ncbi:MAG: hypothetical protein HQK53_19115, partial [Oligoflexia bacterium]|nr:hypothetical protein [Oligoflexia bacterium]
LFTEYTASRARRVALSSTVSILDNLIGDGAFATEGIFRIAGNKTRVEEAHGDSDINKALYLALLSDKTPLGVHDKLSLLKKYLREDIRLFDRTAVPIPINKFLNDNPSATGGEMEEFLREHLSTPEQDVALLTKMLSFCKMVVNNSAKNRMEPSNLATAFAPSIMAPPQSMNPSEIPGYLEDINSFFTKLFTTYTTVVNVPGHSSDRRHTAVARNVKVKSIATAPSVDFRFFNKLWWGEVEKDSEGGEIQLNHYDAISYCVNKYPGRDCRLPARTEYEKLALQEDWPYILRDLKNRAFWSLTVHPETSGHAYFFSGYTGLIEDIDRDQSYWVRCVCNP